MYTITVILSLRKTIPKTIDGLSLYFLTDTREFSTCYYPGKFIGRRTDEYNQVLNCFVYADGSRQDLAAEVTLFGYKVPSVIEIRKALNQYNEFDPIILKAFDIKQQNLIKQQQEKQKSDLISLATQKELLKDKYANSQPNVKRIKLEFLNVDNDKIDTQDKLFDDIDHDDDSKRPKTPPAHIKPIHPASYSSKYMNIINEAPNYAIKFPAIYSSLLNNKQNNQIKPIQEEEEEEQNSNNDDMDITSNDDGYISHSGQFKLWKESKKVSENLIIAPYVS